MNSNRDGTPRSRPTVPRFDARSDRIDRCGETACDENGGFPKGYRCLAGTIQQLDQTADCVKLIDKLRKANG